jgi:hypothetical protein
VIEKRTYLLRADLVGSYILPEVSVTYHPAIKQGEDQSEPVTLKTSKIFLEVKSVLPADGSATDIRDIKALKRPDYGLPVWAWILIGVTILIVMAVGSYLLLGRRSKEAAPPAPPPHEVAYAALEALRSTDFDDPQQLHKYYFAISWVLREYLENRFGLNATDLTTGEILTRARNHLQLGQDERSLLKSFLEHTDLVKFAEVLPEETEIRACYQQAIRFIQSTTAVPEPQERRVA